MAGLKTICDLLKGYSAVEAAFNYDNPEGRLLFFINTRHQNSELTNQFINEFARETQKIKDYKWYLSNKKGRNVGLYYAICKWFDGEDEQNGYGGYETFWKDQPLKLEGMEHCCYLKENWYQGQDSYLFLRKDPKIKQELITKEQALLIEYTLQYVSQNEEDKKNFECAWPWICSTTFRSFLENSLHGEIKNWEIYKNFEDILFDSNNKIYEKSKKLAELVAS